MLFIGAALEVFLKEVELTWFEVKRPRRCWCLILQHGWFSRCEISIEQMREEFCRDVPLEIYHLLLIDKGIYQQPDRRGRWEGAEVWTRVPVLELGQSHRPSFGPTGRFCRPDNFSSSTKSPSWKYRWRFYVAFEYPWHITDLLLDSAKRGCKVSEVWRGAFEKINQILIMVFSLGTRGLSPLPLYLSSTGGSLTALLMPASPFTAPCLRRLPSLMVSPLFPIVSFPNKVTDQVVWELLTLMSSIVLLNFIRVFFDELSPPA